MSKYLSVDAKLMLEKAGYSVEWYGSKRTGTLRLEAMKTPMDRHTFMIDGGTVDATKVNKVIGK